MRFLLTPDLRKNGLLCWTLNAYLSLTLLFFAANFAFESARFGLWPDAIRDSIRGNPDLFIAPRDLVTLLTDLHLQLFLYPIAIITVLSIFMHTPFRERTKLVIASSATTLCLVDAAAILAVRSLHPWFSWIKSGAFFLFQTTMMTVITLTLIHLSRRTDAKATRSF